MQTSDGSHLGRIIGDGAFRRGRTDIARDRYHMFRCGFAHSARLHRTVSPRGCTPLPELSKLAYEWPSERRNLLNGLKRTRANRNRVGCCCLVLSLRLHHCQGGPQPFNLSSRANPDFLFAALERAACAVFCMENRMEFATPPALTGNPGQPRDLRCASPSSNSAAFKAFTLRSCFAGERTADPSASLGMTN